MSKDTFDPTKYNNSNNEPFASVMERELSRRSILRAGMGMAAVGMLSGVGLAGCSSSATNSTVVTGTKVKLGFDSIAGVKLDAVAVPKGYSAQVLAPWGTPLNDLAQEWQVDGSNSAIDQANSLGMHHDGMHYFPLNGSSTDGLLCINHEYIDQKALHPTGTDYKGLRTILDEVRKEINAHGVTVVRIKQTNGRWDVVKNDSHNRRFTAATTMDISGPVANKTLLETPFSPNGDKVRGTLNNCGNGYTPWGTYLTCEENWPGYFVNTGTQAPDQSRIGIDDKNTRYGWDDLAGNRDEIDDEFTRFDITETGNNATEDYRNEANGHGYIVEIDPYNNQSSATKRTALGRFRHEGCVFGQVVEGKPIVFYSGHDSRFEYIYKFVSDVLWEPADANRTDRLTVGEKYMDQGTLYVARFDDSGVGVWLPLTMTAATKDQGVLADHFTSLAGIILNTAGAADLVGATPMDRPEWAAVDPVNGAVYMTLTNNTKRTRETNVANPRLNNSTGHIIRWQEGDNAELFSWDIFVFGAAEDAVPEVNISGLAELNQFASPDGLAFDARGIMWMQTDNGAPELTEYTNDQMLAVIPSQLTTNSGDLDTINSDNQAALKRFFVGPNGAEVTGLAFSPAQTDLFLNVQHPSNWPYSSDATMATPRNKTVRPRAATVIIRKNDGGEIGV
ncbi:PhoX family phosphatase [Moritella sp. Urea-trap-13]|uniref:PhoX family protein n=1 Tax=Moritella sp. Urea-trap-13 TaxID=2058327 RepID=UPI000C32C879|nr:PhoX family phosphatase [Moritella sp. Urea-trap-13]PKH04688.1 dTDP-glucose 4,6-dehydratase [Moritella sp. Urea-trap-13]